jgi:cytochrome b561
MEQRYTRTAMLLHWLIALLLLAQFGFGWWLDEVPRNTPERGFFINWHKSTGIIIGLLILLRIVWRLMHTPPPLPQTIPHWQQRLASLNHLLMYSCMVLMPLSGYVASNFSKYGVKFFNAVKWAPWGSEDKLIYAIFNQTHKITAIVLAALIVLHLLALIKHALIDRDQLFSRMWRRPDTRG